MGTRAELDQRHQTSREGQNQGRYPEIQEAGHQAGRIVYARLITVPRLENRKHEMLCPDSRLPIFNHQETHPAVVAYPLLCLLKLARTVLNKLLSQIPVLITH